MKKVFENDEQVENIGFQVFKLMVKQDRQREQQLKDQQKEPTGGTVELTTEKIETNKVLAQNYFSKKEECQRELK